MLIAAWTLRALHRSAMKVFKLVLTFLLIAPPIFASENHYVDLDAITNGSGTHASPWNSVVAVNSHVMTTGDDVYFKVGTSEAVSAGVYLDVDWGGSVADQVIIGAYESDGDFTLEGDEARPIIDGNDVGPSDVSNGLINISTTSLDGYITVRDLEVKQSVGIGIRFTGKVVNDPNFLTNMLVQNCYVHHCGRQGIAWAAVSYSSILDNIVDYCPEAIRTGASIEAQSGSATLPYETTKEILAAGNIVTNGGSEGINFHYNVVDSEISNNIICNAGQNVGIYVESASRNVVRDNIVYFTPGGKFPTNILNGIELNSEAVSGYSRDVERNVVCGNIVVGCQEGITLNDNAGAIYNDYNKNNAVYNNTIIDCNYNFAFYNTNPGWTGNLIKNNLSWTITSGMLPTNLYSPTGVTWGHNLFDDDMSGAAATNAIELVDPGLTKTSGWRTITAGTFGFDDNWVDILATGSKTPVDAGAHLTTVLTSGSGATVAVTDIIYFGRRLWFGFDSNNDGTIDFIDQVVSVNHAASTATLANSHSYTAGGKIYYATSATDCFIGTSVDIGAKEFNGPSQNHAPSFSAATGDTTLYADGSLSVNFSCTASDIDSDTISYLWDLTTSGAYATNSTVEDPGALTIIDPASYPTTYAITLTATDEHGLSSVWTFDIVVEESASVECTPDEASLVMDQPAEDNGASAGVNAFGQSVTFSEGDRLSKIRFLTGATTTACVAEVRIGTTPDLSTYSEVWTGVAIAAGSNWVEVPSVDNDTFSGVVYIGIVKTSGTTLTVRYDGTSPSYTGGSYYSTGTVFILGAADASRDLTMQVLKCAIPVPVLQDLIGVSPDGHYKAGSSVTIAAVFDIPIAGLDADTIVCETGGTDTTFSHSSPVEGVSSRTHYFTATVQASTTSADLSANSVTVNGETQSIPSGHDLNDNAAMVIDTTALALTNVYLSSSSGSQITATTTAQAGDTFYVSVEADGPPVIAGGSANNVALPLLCTPENIMMMFSGITGNKIIFSHTVQSGERTLDATITGVGDIVFDYLGSTVTVQDQAGNAVAGDLPHDWLVDANNFSIAGETTFGGSYTEFIAAYDFAVPGDVLNYTKNTVENISLTDDGTELNPIVANGNGYTLTCDPSCDFGGDWWSFYGLNIKGDYEISGDHIRFYRHGITP